VPERRAVVARARSVVTLSMVMEDKGRKDCVSKSMCIEKESKGMNVEHNNNNNNSSSNKKKKNRKKLAAR
jgi:hypothetical protein